jgi:hypothetical protein
VKGGLSRGVAHEPGRLRPEEGHERPPGELVARRKVDRPDSRQPVLRARAGIRRRETADAGKVGAVRRARVEPRRQGRRGRQPPSRVDRHLPRRRGRQLGPRRSRPRRRAARPPGRATGSGCSVSR